MSEDKSRKLDSAFKERRKQTFTPLKRVERDRNNLCSNLQEALFLDFLKNPQNIKFNIGTLYLVDNCENERIFLNALEKCIRIHEINRTKFSFRDNKVFQDVVSNDSFTFPLNIIDISSMDFNSQKLEMQNVFKDFCYTPFDLKKAPLFRVMVFKLGPNRLGLLRVFHHSIFDGSTDILFCRELSSLYSDLLVNQQPRVKAPEFHFIDYAAWERENMTDYNLKPLIHYWKSYLAGVPKEIPWPYDFPRDDSGDQQVHLETIKLNSEIWLRTKAIAKAEGISELQALMTVLAIFIFKFCDAPVFCLSSAIDLRRNRGLPNLMGPLANEFLIRCEVDETLTFTEFSKKLVREFKKGVVKADILDEKVISAVGREIAATSILYFPKARLDNLDLLKVTPIFAEVGGGTWDLVCQFRDDSSGAYVDFRYDSSLFKKTTILNMLDQFHTIFEEVITSPSKKIYELTSFHSRDEAA